MSDYRDHFKREHCVEGREVSYSPKSCGGQGRGGEGRGRLASESRVTGTIS